ncbi:AraC family transcriptional regulator [Paenibacillus illinoisensis]|uniref:AraC family transcriptional regulator n=1 Tax=Paenibacillus illinoisensis TaxID=59845 RepID=UPI003015AF03
MKNLKQDIYYMDYAFQDTAISIHSVTIRESKIQRHAHSFYEFSYISSGKGTYEARDHSVSVSQGDLVFIPPDTEHAFFDEPDQPITLINCLVERHVLTNPIIINDDGLHHDIDYLLSSFRDCSQGLKVRDNKKELGQIIFDLKLEQQSKESGYRFRLYLKFMNLLNRIRCFKESDAQYLNEETSDPINYVINYIYNHYNEAVDLAALCEGLLLSPRQFQRKFKQVTGITYTQMLQNVRIQQSCKLLCDTNWSVQTIAREVGLSDMKHFYRLFKERCGMTPNDFRQPENTHNVTSI